MSTRSSTSTWTASSSPSNGSSIRGSPPADRHRRPAVDARRRRGGLRRGGAPRRPSRPEPGGRRDAVPRRGVSRRRGRALSRGVGGGRRDSARAAHDGAGRGRVDGDRFGVHRVGAHRRAGVARSGRPPRTASGDGLRVAERLRERLQRELGFEVACGIARHAGRGPDRVAASRVRAASSTCCPATRRGCSRRSTSACCPTCRPARGSAWCMEQAS